MIIRLSGGLGNQMFQYAFGRSLSIQKKCDLLIDISGYDRQHPGDTPRAYKLNKLQVKGTLATDKDTAKRNSFVGNIFSKIHRKLNPEKLYAYNKKTADNAHCDSYIEGFWQNEKYFAEHADAIRKDFMLAELFGPAAERMHERIRISNNPVSLHIRRGDYVSDLKTHLYHGTLPIEYYQKALKHLTDHIGSHFTVFIFSDDIEWARTHAHQYVPESAEIVYVSDNNIADYEEMALMSLCQHHIIANSSFSWWGAWLNPRKEKVVIAPKQWTANPAIDSSDATPANWIRM